jgi:hypothetical protein
MSDLPIPVLFRKDPVVPIDNTSAGIGFYGQYVLGASLRTIANATRSAR